VYWTEGLVEKGLGMARGDIDAHVPVAEFPTLHKALKDWKTQHPNFVLDVWYIQPRPFTNNTAYSFARGVQTYYMQTEFHRKTDPSTTDPNTWMNDLPAVYKDQLNFVFDGTTLWNIGKVGFEHNHSTNITIQNSRIVGYGARTGFENYGTNPAPNFVKDEPEVIGLDLDYYYNTHDWVLSNNTIEGFSGNSVGIALPKNAQVTIKGGTFNNEGTDILVQAASEHLTATGDGFGVGMRSTRPTKSTLTIEGAVTFKNANKNIVLSAEIIYDEVPQKGFPMLSGAKTDPEYLFAPQEITLNFGQFSNTKVYFNEQDGSYVPITSGNQCAISSSSDCVDSKYLNQTNTQLKTKFGKSFLGAIMPSTAVTNALVVGGKVDGGVTSALGGISPAADQIISYPVPVYSQLKLKLPPSLSAQSQITATIYDTRGKQLLTSPNAQAGVDLSSLPAGTYMLHLHIRQGQHTRVVTKMISKL
jgi:hypothetical protein